MNVLKKILTSSEELNRVQDAIKAAYDPLANDPLLSRQEISVDFAASGSKTIAHGLQRQPAGWLVSDRNSAANVWRNSWDRSTITLQSSAAVNIKIIIF